MLDDSRLRYFSVLVQEGSFTRAARRLGVSQPAVSQSISDLEKQLGVKLFERTRQSVALTPEGETFRSYASEILKWYDAAGAMFALDGKATIHRPLTVRCPAFIAETVIPDLLSDSLGITADTFSVRTVPDGEASTAGGDIVLYTAPRKETLEIEEASTLVGSVEAAAASREPDAEPSFAALAIWRPYEKYLGADYLSRVSMSSDSPAAAIRTAERVRGMVCIVPHPCLKGSALTIIPHPMPRLQLDLHIRFGERIDRTGLAAVLKRKLLSIIT